MLLHCSICILTYSSYTIMLSLYTLELAGQDGDVYEGTSIGKKTNAGNATSNISKTTSKSRSEGKESRK